MYICLKNFSFLKILGRVWGPIEILLKCFSPSWHLFWHSIFQKLQCLPGLFYPTLCRLKVKITIMTKNFWLGGPILKIQVSKQVSRRQNTFALQFHQLLTKVLFESDFCKYWVQMRSNRNLTELKKWFSPSWHLFRHSNFQNLSTSQKLQCLPGLFYPSLCGLKVKITILTKDCNHM